MAAPTFNYTPHRASPGRRRVPRVTVSKMGDGFEQRVQNGLQAFDVFWDLVFDNVDLSEVQAIDAFLVARRNVEPFFWTPPRESTPILWICEGELKESAMLPLSSSYEVTFMQWFGAEE